MAGPPRVETQLHPLKCDLLSVCADDVLEMRLAKPKLCPKANFKLSLDGTNVRNKVTINYNGGTVTEDRSAGNVFEANIIDNQDITSNASATDISQGFIDDLESVVVSGSFDVYTNYVNGIYSIRVGDRIKLQNYDENTAVLGVQYIVQKVTYKDNSISVIKACAGIVLVGRLYNGKVVI